MTNDDELPERIPPLSLSAVAREFDVTRDTAKSRLLRSGANPTRDNCWRVRDILLAFVPPGHVIPLDVRLEIERKRAIEALSQQLRDLAEQVRALPVLRKHVANRNGLASAIRQLAADD